MLVHEDTYEPAISVYMPTHNRCSLLKRAVNSVLAQTFKYFELIIIDDASSDQTPAYLEELANRDKRVRYFRNETSQGACFARNRAIELAEGEFVTGIDDDDEFLPQRLSKLLGAYTNEYGWVSSRQYCDYGKKRKLLGGELRVVLLSDMLGFNYAYNQVLVKRKDIKAAGLFDIEMPACQDWDMWTRLTEKIGPGLVIREPLYIVHTAHDSPRISTSESRRKGYQIFYNKHSGKMSNTNLRDFKLASKRANGEKILLNDMFRLMTRNNYIRLFKLYLKSNVPFIPKLRQLYLTGQHRKR